MPADAAAHLDRARDAAAATASTTEIERLAGVRDVDARRARPRRRSTGSRPTRSLRDRAQPPRRSTIASLRPPQCTKARAPSGDSAIASGLLRRRGSAPTAVPVRRSTTRQLAALAPPEVTYARAPSGDTATPRAPAGTGIWRDDLPLRDEVDHAQPTRAASLETTAARRPSRVSATPRVAQADVGPRDHALGAEVDDRHRRALPVAATARRASAGGAASARRAAKERRRRRSPPGGGGEHRFKLATQC